MGKNIYLIFGKSGSGKTTLVEYLKEHHGLKVVRSYTTRPRRYPEEDSYVFVSDEEFDRLGEMIAYTEYNGYRYGTTAEVANANDLYVIDPYGIQFMLERYKGPKNVVVIQLYVEPDELRKRMKKRGQTDEWITKRMAADAAAFDLSRFNIPVDFTVHADGIEETAKAVYAYILYKEKYAENEGPNPIYRDYKKGN